MTMTLDKATSFLRMLQNGQIDRRPIGEWIGLREACGVILAHLTQPEQSGDVAKSFAGLRIVENADVLDGEVWVYDKSELVGKITAALQEKGNGSL